MKIKPFNVFAFFCILSLNIYSQDKLEIKAILERSSLDNLNILKQKVEEDNLSKSTRIESFLSQNKQLKINRKNVYDIIDGKVVIMGKDNLNSSKATRTNFLLPEGGLGLNLEGYNIRIGVWDGGIILDSHREFYDTSDFFAPPRVEIPTPEVSSQYDDHATHVAGTIASAGINANAKGMAPRSKLVTYNWVQDSYEVIGEIESNALLLSNHSYGVPVFNDNGVQNAPSWMMGNYNSDCVSWDNIAYNSPYYLMVASAGNEGQSNYTGALGYGYDKLTTEKNAKNNLVVANASNPVIDAYGNLISLAINSSSSQGPTDDFRVKPDIAGDGTSVFSTTDESDSSYGTKSGTSMAAPNVTGSLALLQEHFYNLNSKYMKSATLKGLVCHTADDDSAKKGPDPIFGWGLLNSKFAAETISNNSESKSLIEERTLGNGETYTTSFYVSNSDPVRVSICWTDPAASASPQQLNSDRKVLVNDLDIRVTHDSNEYLPWKLNSDNVAGVAIKDDNDVDNIERIDIDNPTPGFYEVTVSHKKLFLQNNQQDYALIITSNDLALDVTDFESNKFKVLFDPLETKIKLMSSINFSPDDNILLFDQNGREVFKHIFKNNNSSAFEIDASNFSDGLYILNYKTNNTSFVKKILIK